MKTRDQNFEQTETDVGSADLMVDRPVVDLATQILETASPKRPQSTSLTDKEEKKIAVLVENFVSEQVAAYGDGSRSAFILKMEPIKEALIGFTLNDPGIKGNGVKKDRVLARGNELAKEWQAFVRNSELLKLIRVNAERILNKSQ